MSAVVIPVHPSRGRPLLCFAVLQLLDLFTTVAVFSRGGHELNPLVARFIPFTGPLFAVLVSKTVLLLLVWRLSRRNWILYFGNFLYAVIVAWNLFMFAIA